jgi:hypothetical protein
MVQTSTLDIVAQNQLNILIHLAKADREFADAERDMIYRICREKNFPEDRLMRMMQEPMPMVHLAPYQLTKNFIT